MPNYTTTRFESEQLKGASKMHAQQAAKIEKMIKTMKPKPKKKK